jgi:putative flippase GtrA
VSTRGAGGVLRRWLKFNAVGVAGMAVQLGVLAVLGHAWPAHYLLASAIAVEAAVLHNFAAHLRYTWRDRREGIGAVGACLRFQISNGGVSLVGNLVLMRVLAGYAHVPVLAANVVSIAACGLANFWLGERWAFAAGAAEGTQRCLPGLA